MPDFEEYARIFASRVEGWELNCLSRIGGRIKKFSRMDISDLQAINNIAVAKGDFEEMIAELAKVTGQNISDLQQMYADVLTEQQLSKKALYDYRGIKITPFAETQYGQAVLNSLARATGNTFINLSQTKGLHLINEAGKAVLMKSEIEKVYGQAITSIITNGTDFHSAMRNGLKALGGGGVRVSYEGSGITRRLDTVMRQNLLWSMKQVTQEYDKVIGEELGCDGVEIDWHSNPRPSHAFMQGKQYAVGKGKYINGEYYEGTDEATSPISGETVTDSLDDYGCLHYTTTVILGVSPTRYSKQELERLNRQNEKPIEIDGVSKTGYYWKQDMRTLETAGRELNGQIATLKASGDSVQKEQAKLNQIKAKYNQISKATGIVGTPQRFNFDVQYYKDVPPKKWG